MMKTKCIIGLLLLLIAKVMFAQNKTAITYQLNGYVSYENRGCNLINADITVNGNNKIYQTNTDSNGHFCLEGLESGFYTIIVSLQGKHKRNFDIFINDYNAEADFEIFKEYNLRPNLAATNSLIISHCGIYESISEKHITAAAA
jgi:hypothetical protein